MATRTVHAYAHSGTLLLVFSMCVYKSYLTLARHYHLTDKEEVENVQSAMVSGRQSYKLLTSSLTS